MNKAQADTHGSLLVQLQSRVAENQNVAVLRQFLRRKLKPLNAIGKEHVSRMLEMISTDGDNSCRQVKLVLENYRRTYFPRLPPRTPAPGMDMLDASTRKYLSLRLNQSRGKTYEHGLGSWVVREAISRLYPDLAVSAEIDKQVFHINSATGGTITRRAGGAVDRLELNVFVQRRDLNRGWSAEGKQYRAMENYCVLKPGTFCFSSPRYEDQTSRPAFLEFGLLKETR